MDPAKREEAVTQIGVPELLLAFNNSHLYPSYPNQFHFLWVSYSCSELQFGVKITFGRVKHN